MHEKRDLESCYFAAQTMRTKIQYSFHELPPEAHVPLRESLLEHMACITTSTSQVIVTQVRRGDTSEGRGRGGGVEGGAG